MGPPVIPGTNSRIFVRTASTFRLSPRKAVLMAPNFPDQDGIQSARWMRLMGILGPRPDMRPDAQEQSENGTSPGVPALPRCCRGCSWEEALSVCCCSVQMGMVTWAEEAVCLTRRLDSPRWDPGEPWKAGTSPLLGSYPCISMEAEVGRPRSGLLWN